MTEVVGTRKASTVPVAAPVEGAKLLGTLPGGGTRNFQVGGANGLATNGPDGTPLVERIGALEAGQAAGQIVVKDWATLSSMTGASGVGAQVVDDAGSHTDPVTSATVPNAGQYVWSIAAESWEWVREDALGAKAESLDLARLANRTNELELIQALAISAINPLLDAGEYIGMSDEPGAGEGSVSNYTFVLPQKVSSPGIADEIRIYGGHSGGDTSILIFNESGGIFSLERIATTVHISPDTLNTISVSIPLAAGQFVGLYCEDHALRFQSAGSETDSRAWRSAGLANTIDSTIAARPGRIQASIRVRSSGYSSKDIASAVEAGEKIIDSFDHFSVATRRPLLLDIDGVHGHPDSLYVPVNIWFTRGSNAVSVAATNQVVMNVAGGYTRIDLSLGDGAWDTGYINTIYYNPVENNIKNIIGTTSPNDSPLTKLLPIFQITGRNGGYRSAAGIHVEVKSSPRGRAVLCDFYDSIVNQLRDCRVVLIGDSITWGMSAEGMSGTEPRGHSLNDVRDNTTSGSWANRLRRWVHKISVNSENGSEPAPGQSVHFKDFTFTPRYDAQFQAIRADGIVPRDPGNLNGGAVLKRFIDSPYSDDSEGRIVFEYVGEDITIIHASLENAAYEFYVDGDLVATYIHSGAVRFGVETELNGIPFGRHHVEIVATGSQIFRLEAIRRRKIVKFSNNGLIGTNTSQWLPGGALLAGAVPEEATHIIIQLGTNDRDMSAGNAYPSGANGTFQNLHDIVKWLSTNRPAAKVILMAPPYVPTDRSFGSSGEIAMSVRRVAKILGTGFIDNLAPSYELALGGDVWLADGIHPNNSGHRRIFQNIQQCITNSAILE